MDNKQDRQFYWEVKNFLGRNTNSLPKTEVKKTSLKESIGNVLKSTDYLYTPKNNSQEIYEEFVSSIDNRMVKSVNSLLDQHKKVLNEASPDLTGQYENITENLFTLNKKKLLNELVAQDLSSVYAQAQAQLAQQLAQNKKTSKKDEEEEEDQAVSSPIMQAPATQAPESLAAAPTAAPATPSSSLAAPSTGTAPGPSRVAALSMRGIDVEPGDKDILVDLRKARGMPKGDRGGRTPEERASNRAEREERNARLLAANIATRGERERLQDQAAEARKQRDDLKKSITVEVEGPPAPGGAQPTAIESQSDKAKDYAASIEVARQAQEQLRKFNERSGYNRPRTEYGNITQATIGARYATKPGEVVAMPDDKIIQGTSMTYGEFKRQAGRNYNPFNKDDSSLVSRLAGAGRYGSEQARQAALSADQMNQAYSAQNTQMAQKAGELEREMDRSQMELDRYRNTPKAERVGQEVSRTATPAMIAKIADEMKQKNLQTQANKDATYGGDMRASSRGVAKASSGPFNVGGMMSPEQAAAANATQSGRFMTGTPLELTQQTPEEIAKLNPPKIESQYPSLIKSFMSQNVPGSIAPGSKKDIENQLKRLRGQ
jgi:hypothetical protein